MINQKAVLKWFLVIVATILYEQLETTSPNVAGDKGVIPNTSSTAQRQPSAASRVPFASAEGVILAALCNSIHLKLLGLKRHLSDKEGERALEDTSGKKRLSNDFCGVFPIDPYATILAFLFRLSGLEAHKYMPLYTLSLEYH